MEKTVVLTSKRAATILSVILDSFVIPASVQHYPQYTSVRLFFGIDERTRLEDTAVAVRAIAQALGFTIDTDKTDGTATLLVHHFALTWDERKTREK